MAMTQEEFLEFLTGCLMIEGEALAMDKPFSPLVFDSTGKLMVAAAFDDKYGIALSLDDLAKCEKPGDIYELLTGKN